jgi:hypothetical protein
MALYRRYAAAPPVAIGWSAARVVAAGFGVALRLTLLACLALGGWLCIRRFPSVSLIPGVVLCTLAVAVWPRRPHIPRYATPVSRGAAPHLYELVDRVAAATGTAAPELIHVDERVGVQVIIRWWPRRRHLVIGIPLFAVLTAPQRVALLAVHLARCRVKDPVDGPIVGGSAPPWTPWSPR